MTKYNKVCLQDNIYIQIQEIQNKVFQEVDQYFKDNMFKTRILDNLLDKCAKMTNDLTEKYINLYIK
jgi:CRISPR/Cas system endoribonuclease Cas6 (RAMP superfamily)